MTTEEKRRELRRQHDLDCENKFQSWWKRMEKHVCLKANEAKAEINGELKTQRNGIRIYIAIAGFLISLMVICAGWSINKSLIAASIVSAQESEIKTLHKADTEIRQTAKDNHKEMIGNQIIINKKIEDNQTATNKALREIAASISNLDGFVRAMHK